MIMDGHAAYYNHTETVEILTKALIDLANFRGKRIINGQLFTLPLKMVTPKLLKYLLKHLLKVVLS